MAVWVSLSMVRPFLFETERYGEYYPKPGGGISSTIIPFLGDLKRTGPDSFIE